MTFFIGYLIFGCSFIGGTVFGRYCFWVVLFLGGTFFGWYFCKWYSAALKEPYREDKEAIENFKSGEPEINLINKRNDFIQ